MQHELPFYIEKDDWKLFCTLLKGLPYHFYVYGSRVKGNHKPFSDIDLLVEENLNEADLNILKEIFEESNLPMKVDIKRRSDMSEEFYKLIKNDLTPLTL